MADPITMTISTPKKRIRRRTEVNLTQIAAVTGYSLSHMSRVFRMKSNPSLKCLETLAHATGYTIEEFVARIRNRSFKIHYNHNPEGT